MTGDELATWAFSLAWVEHQCFVSVGRWSVASTVDGVTVALGSASSHHGWRSEQWRELWPVRRGAVDGAAAPPSGADDRLDGLLDQVVAADQLLGSTDAGPWDETTSLAALGVVTQMIFPRLLVGYRTVARVAEGPSGIVARRIAERSMSDATADFVALSAKLTVLGGAPTAAGTVAAWRARR